jgi:hypothetical protein
MRQRIPPALEEYLTEQATRFLVSASQYQFILKDHPDLDVCYNRALRRWHQTDYLKEMPSSIADVRKFLKKAGQALDQPDDKTVDVITYDVYPPSAIHTKHHKSDRLQILSGCRSHTMPHTLCYYC